MTEGPWARPLVPCAPISGSSAPLLIFLAKISGTRYHEPSAQDARRRIAAFFGKHLKN